MREHQAPPYLETSRLLLRRIAERDVDDLVALDADAEVVRFVPLAEPTTPTRALAWVRSLPEKYYDQPGGFGFWAVIERDGGRFCGWYHLKPVSGVPHAGEIGYRLRRDAWGKGYATELTLAVIAGAMRIHGLQSIVARALEGNVASTRVMRKAGMRLVRRFTDDSGQDVVEYATDSVPHAPA